MSGWSATGERLQFHRDPGLERKEGIGIAGWDAGNRGSSADVVPGMDAAKVGLQSGDIL